jgi:hypothetical protein
MEFSFFYGCAGVNRSTTAFLKDRNNLDRLRLKTCFRTGTSTSEQPLITKPWILSGLTDLDDLKPLRSLNISESDIGYKDRNSKHDEGEGNTPGLLYGNWK